MKLENSQLLRFTTAGSVDDGKSTLIGRLLYDSKSIFEDQLAGVETTTKRKALGWYIMCSIFKKVQKFLLTKMWLLALLNSLGVLSSHNNNAARPVNMNFSTKN